MYLLHEQSEPEVGFHLIIKSLLSLFWTDLATRVSKLLLKNQTANILSFMGSSVSDRATHYSHCNTEAASNTDMNDRSCVPIKYLQNRQQAQFGPWAMISDSPYLWNEQAPSFPYIKWHLSAAEESLWLSKPNFSTTLDVTWTFPYCLLSAMRREEREGVKMPDNLNSNEVLLLRMFHMFLLLMCTKFCKRFTCGENWDWGCQFSEVT